MERHFGYKNGLLGGILRSTMSCHRLASYGDRQKMGTMSRIIATLLSKKNNNPSLLFRLVRVANLLLYVLAPTLVAAIELSDIPMITRIHPPPANIMFVLDDSSSMNFDILVRGGYDGTFPTPLTPAGQRGFCYLFDDVGDNVYKFSSQPDWYSGPEGRKSQHEVHSLA
jgi:hypothetical protein